VRTGRAWPLACGVEVVDGAVRHGCFAGEGEQHLSTVSGITERSQSLEKSTRTSNAVRACGPCSGVVMVAELRAASRSFVFGFACGRLHRDAVRSPAMRLRPAGRAGSSSCADMAFRRTWWTARITRCAPSSGSRSTSRCASTPGAKSRFPGYRAVVREESRSHGCRGMRVVPDRAHDT
jgi:hypothetical protein